MTKDLICIQCGAPRSIGRRICTSCNKKRLLKFVYSRPRYTFTNTCFICQNDFKAWRKRQRLCKECRNLTDELSSETTNTNNYINIKGDLEHRLIAEQILGRKLFTDEIVHHIDDSPVNNDRSNLAVMSRITHGKLHLFLNVIKAFCYYCGSRDFFIRNVKNMTEQWAIETKEIIVFL